MKNLVEKYRPEKFDDVVGQDQAIEKVKNYLLNFPEKKKALLLGGNPGVGKTTIVHVLAKENNLELFELNASDLRNKVSLSLRLKPVMEHSPLFKKNKLILIDEADGITGTDRGGIPELIKLIDETRYPIICTANDPWIQKLSPLRKKSEIIQLKEISPEKVKIVLKKILKEENKTLKDSTINKIAIASKGDLRSAINDLETILEVGDEEEILIDERNKHIDIFHALRKIFQEKANNEMLSLFDKVDMPIDEIILWIEENIPKVYKKVDLEKAYDRLSKTDLFKGRIYKQQYWRFLVYENIFSSYGISEAKGKKEITGFYKYRRPERLLKIWLNNRKHAKRKTIAEKYSRATHVGQKRILAEWREIKPILKNPIVQKQLKLDDDEIEYVMKY